MDSNKLSVGKIGGYVMMLLVALIIGVPLVWMLIGSLMSTRDILNPNQWLPTTPVWDNYPDAWNSVPFARFFLNSIIITVFGAGSKVVLGVLCAYAFAFLKFPGKNILFLVVLASLMVPSQVVIIPNYQFMSTTIRNILGTEGNWVNTYQGIILPSAATAFGTFLMRQGFMGLPKDVLDAAKVDGAGHIRTMWQVILPMAKPIVVTFGLIAVVGEWNEYLWPLIITNTDNMRPVTVGLRLLNDAEGNNNWGVIMAGTALVVMPMLIVYTFLQRFIIDGLTAGATKG
ncbi:MAG: carbohydrate ABC transporter permease [Thermomicrobiales bacterium]|nr:carbohydrate ABC transporter permease [Thermomicrobiales bacterium]MCO5217566.1 carbohydrate ABC transporter permease [Thermomicrobiales bacterium]MCO5224128.1 carbohydrate ABC transporter permease [Thermomicrobiales bacterium]MCO5226963.1 carbohydrate ABC transporter permease [Thermomicrobiales bacterium]